MKTTADPVRDYLSAVERETSVLPADRRQELLADLAEHIEVTRAERPDTPLTEILADLGDPRTIASTALTEAGTQQPPTPTPPPRRRGKVHPSIPILLLLLALPMAVIFPNDEGSLVGGLLRITGAVLLCTSVHWTAVQKITGVMLAAVIPMALIAALNRFVETPVSETGALVTNLVIAALLFIPTTWLWRVRRA
ncbi:hypothetical protein AB0D49_11925 [Streptomyces sp. NPDC048290]|uniref:HAAS signaling domain-containing protein n=1 Tax=Streptomyces sp. NPDC048290 TaxID=3155811 RepID=UPI0034456641